MTAASDCGSPLFPDQHPLSQVTLLPPDHFHSLQATIVVSGCIGILENASAFLSPLLERTLLPFVSFLLPCQTLLGLLLSVQCSIFG